jgi:hypothetical protein
MQKQMEASQVISKEKGGRNMRTKPRQHKRTENNANLRRAGVGRTEIERPKTQNQKTRKQTNKKQSRRRESNPPNTLTALKKGI